MKINRLYTGNQRTEYSNLLTEGASGDSSMKVVLVTIEGALYDKSNWKGSNLVAMALVAKDTSLGKKPSEPISE